MDEQTIADIRWLAELVKAQALSEQKALDRENNAYSDRPWSGRDLNVAGLKAQRCQRVLDALDKLAESEPPASSI